MKKPKYVFLNLFFLFSLLSCSTTDPKLEPELLLKLEDVSCTEVWLQLITNNIQLPATINLLKNNTITQTFSLSTKDSLLYIDSLLPSQTYKFQSIIQSTNQSMEVRSNGLTVTTLVPTSQNFTWQAYSWGMHSSSTLYDVAIINENDIWVVGEIYMNDSLGNPDPACYNAVHWDSSGNWQKKKIKTNSCGGVDYPPIKTIFAFSKDDILFAHIDGSISHFNGVEFINDCSLITQLDGSANKIWGIASNDFYVVSSNGFIAHYQNGSWQKIESGTNIDFRDIYGSANEDTNELEIIALASNILAKPGKRLLRIKNQTVQTLPDSGLSNYLSTIWFMSDRKYCLGGQGYYESRTFGPVWERNTSIPQFHITSIRGAGLNDIVLGGTFGLLMHYNGVSWMNYANITAAYFDVISSVAIKGNTIVAAGFMGSKAVVLVGKR